MEIPDDKLSLITSRLQEIIGLDELQKIIQSRPLKIYFGTAPTGRIHIGYLVPLLKIADFLKAGCEVKILFADLHAVLDNLKSTMQQVEFRTSYYEKMIKSILKNLNVPLDKLTFVRGSSFQLSQAYTMDMYKISTLATLHDAKKAGAEVVKQTDNPKMSGLLYPILQALDEQYLDVDAQFGGVDQRKLFTFAADVLPLIGYKKRIHLMNPMLTAINAMPKDSNENTNISEIKMSSSDLNSKIDMLDSKNEIKKKINRAYCLEGDLSFNPLMELMKHVTFPLLNNCGSSIFKINRKEIHGGPLSFSNYADLEKDFVEKKLHPQDLKTGIIDCLNLFMEPIRAEFNDKESQSLIKQAYN
ncbi:tyrosine-tRNA synthetase [Tupanvirus deep ocean]|uniref:Tyrosine-tRNA synthetase n=2 Tax=Tupanvirus TaxID=2094720 RepID=A0AC62AA52_9VIRU|nr:tyrosine-tRNA synthetase [Tupanvirus deep ocean]QKU34614.1 tyrosine-tRNA synthetase [Tupanvirus deep ocean]